MAAAKKQKKMRAPTPDERAGVTEEINKAFDLMIAQPWTEASGVVRALEQMRARTLTFAEERRGFVALEEKDGE